jgi:hypothetical protein
MYTVKKNDKESYYGVYLNGKKKKKKVVCSLYNKYLKPENFIKEKKQKKKRKIENYISWGLKKKKQTN